MTLSTSQNRVQYTGNAVTTAFSYAYLFYAQTDLEVYLDDAIQVAGFTITGEGNPAGGTVTFSSAPAVGVVVTILRKVDLSQETDFENFDGNPADVTEKQFDLCVMMSQQLADSIERSLVFPATLSGSLVGELPQPVDNKTLVWDGTTGLVKNGPDAIDVSTAVADAEAAQAAAEAAAVAAAAAQSGAEIAEDNAVAAAAGASIGNLFLLTTGTIATDDYIAFSDTSASNVGKKTTLANVDAGLFGSGSATDNYVLTADGSGGAAWEAGSTLPDQTGNSGRYLSTNGTIPIWAPVSVTTGIVPIKTTTVSSPVSSVDFVNGTGGVVLDSTYKAYMVVMSSVIPSTDGVDLWLRTSTNAGSSYDTGASDYRHGTSAIEAQDTPTTLLGGDSADGQIKITNSRQLGSDTGESFHCVLYVFAPSVTKYTIAGWNAHYHSSNGVLSTLSGAGSRLSAADVDAIRFLMSSGNIASGTFTLYGLKDA